MAFMVSSPGPGIVADDGDESRKGLRLYTTNGRSIPLTRFQIGSEPAGENDSFDSGEDHIPNQMATAAVDDILPVGEDALLAAMRLLIEKAGILPEPSGGAGIAALVEHGARFQGKAVAVIITGSNLDPKLLPRLAA